MNNFVVLLVRTSHSTYCSHQVLDEWIYCYRQSIMWPLFKEITFMRAMDCKYNRFNETNYFHYKKRKGRRKMGRRSPGNKLSKKAQRMEKWSTQKDLFDDVGKQSFHNLMPMICWIYNLKEETNSKRKESVNQNSVTQLSIRIDGSPTCHPGNHIYLKKLIIIITMPGEKDQRLTAKLGTCLRVYLWLTNISFSKISVHRTFLCLSPPSISLHFD